MKRRAWFAGVVVGLGLVALAVLPRIESVDSAPKRTLSPEQQEAVRSLQTFSEGFVAVADLVIPSVVTITSEKMVEAAAGQNPFGNDPFFRRFFGDRQAPEPQPFRQRGLGSGVIVSEDGLIITNNHVIRGADELTVLLYDGRRLEAEVVGSDARSDIAVLRVEAEDLPAVTFGDSESLRIGEWVVAVGSPFSENLNASVTAGIVSAKGRSGMNLNEYEDFIQTDAAINPGNSGGALVNLNGELVGINSAIATRNGGSNGIGFAIPVDMAQDIMNDLVTQGRVSRGWLGVGIQSVDQNLAEAMDLPGPFGVLITSVQEGSPAEDAGFETGDVIVSFDGETVRDASELRLAVAKADPGTRRQVDVVRNGRERQLGVLLGERPHEFGASVQSPSETEREDLGLRVEPITPSLANRFDLEDARGLVVTSVVPGGPADDEGIRPGDVLLKVNQGSVSTIRDFLESLESVEPGKPVLLQMERQGTPYFAAVRPE